MRPVVLAYRHPDYETTFSTFPGDGDPIAISVDQGSAFDGEPDDFDTWKDWADGYMADARDLHRAGQEAAADELVQHVMSLKPTTKED